MFLTQWESEEFVTTQNSALHHNAFATLSGEIAVGYPHHFLDYRNRKRGKIIFLRYCYMLGFIIYRLWKSKWAAIVRFQCSAPFSDIKRAQVSFDVEEVWQYDANWILL